MPKLLNAVPVLDLATLEQEAHVVRATLLLSFITNEKVKLWVVEVVSLANPTLLSTNIQVRSPHRKARENIASQRAIKEM